MRFPICVSRHGIGIAAALLLTILMPQFVGAQDKSARILSHLSDVKTGARKHVSHSALNSEALRPRFTSRLRLGVDDSAANLAAAATLKSLANTPGSVSGSRLSRRLTARLDALNTRLRLNNNASSSKSDWKGSLTDSPSRTNRLSQKLTGETSHNDLGASLHHLSK